MWWLEADFISLTGNQTWALVVKAVDPKLDHEAQQVGSKTSVLVFVEEKKISDKTRLQQIEHLLEAQYVWKNTWADSERQRDRGLCILGVANWGQEEKGMTEDEMAGWHHWLDEHEFE